MSIPMDSLCFQCFVRSNIELVKPLGTEEQTMDFLRELMAVYLKGPKDAGSTWFGPQIADMLHERYGLPIDRLRQEKLDSNRFVLEQMPLVREKIVSSGDPVFAALQFAILGNYLDFAALRGQVSFDALARMLDKAREMELDRAVYDSLCRDLEGAKSLLYITDNAGEIGFDRLLAEEIARRYPQVEITFCVRGAVTSNDATREDAEAVGIPFKVIDNGNRIAGTQLDMLGQEARDAMEKADVILAKGMANVETMLDSGYNSYYAFLVKCQRFVNIFEKPLMTPMLVKERK